MRQTNRFTLLFMPATLFAAQIKVTTADSLSLTKNVYVSILFTATRSNSAEAPAAYSFTESGNMPPGMIFESYPCNKPSHPPCASVAKADGIFLDGVPSAAGSYTFQITAADPKGNNTRESFTVTVSNSN